ncbi:MAG: signal peptidase I [Planctomycetota bacterium]
MIDSERPQNPGFEASANSRDASLPLTPGAAIPGEFVITEVSPAKESPRKLRHTLLFETITVLVLAVLLAVGLHVFVTQVYAISGQSMEPTLRDGERVVILKLKLSPVEREDLIIFTSPNDSNKNLIKRVIGISGDTVRITRDGVWINGKLLEEAYVRNGLYSSHYRTWVVPEEHVFVLGDNRPQSQDSRHFKKFIPISSIKGKVFLRLWPLDALTTFP